MELHSKMEAVEEEEEKCGGRKSRFRFKKARIPSDSSESSSSSSYVSKIRSKDILSILPPNRLDKECECGDIQEILRSAIEDLKRQNMKKTDEATKLKSQMEHKKLKCTNLAKELKEAKEEQKRSDESFQRHEKQIKFLQTEIETLREFCNRELGPEMEARLAKMKKQKEAVEMQLKSLKEEWETRNSQLRLELNLERERADHFLVQGIQEREELEAHWKNIWEDHAASLTDQIKALKANYENPLKNSEIREKSLQKELTQTQERYDKSKSAWEDYRRTLFEQLTEWKTRFTQKCGILDELRVSKVETETILQQKLEDLNICQDMLNKGVEERQSLQRKFELMQKKMREYLAPISITRDGTIKSNHCIKAKVKPNKSGFTVDDFLKLKNIMLEDLENGSLHIGGRPPTSMSIGYEKYQAQSLQASINPPNCPPSCPPKPRRVMEPPQIGDIPSFTIGKGLDQPNTKFHPAPITSHSSATLMNKSNKSLSTKTSREIFNLRAPGPMANSRPLASRPGAIPYRPGPIPSRPGAIPSRPGPIGPIARPRPISSHILKSKSKPAISSARRNRLMSMKSYSKH